jgi:hypothetical protein
MAYVEAACDKCGLLLQKNELRDWRQEVETERTSESFGTYADGSTKYQGPKSTFRIDNLKLCPDCYIRAKEAQDEEARRWELERREAEIASRAARRRRGGAARVLLLSITILVLLLIAGAIVGNLPKRGAPDLAAGNTLATTASNPTATPAATASPATATTDANQSAPTAAASPAPEQPDAPLPPQEAPSSGDANLGIDGAPATPENTPALSKAVADALNSGTPKPWSANGRSGEVTVGDERFYRGRPCRSFAYTSGATTAPTAYACAGPDGVWRPAHNFDRAQGE